MREKYLFIIKRMAHSMLVLLALSILIFSLSRIIPGDPVKMALGPRVPEATIERVREDMHFDDPIYIQYFYWIKGALKGDFGESLYTKRNVVDDIKQYFPASLELILLSWTLMVVGGIMLGVISGRHANTWIDNVIRGVSYIGVCVPNFVFAIFFVLLFSYILPILPTTGRLSEFIASPPNITNMILLDALIAGNFTVFFDALKHFILPVLSLCLPPMAQILRLTRTMIIENSVKDYILFAEACGVDEQKVMYKYLLKPSVIPSVAVLGMNFASLFANAFLVELIFNWPGFSRYGMNAILRKDLNAIIATVLVLGLTFVVMNIIVDLVVEVLDPRIKLAIAGGETE